MESVRWGVFMLASVMVSSVFAGPKIEFDTKTFKCGEVIEGKVDKLNAVFNVKNTGNAVLTLKNVRPGCGCTVVKYDTTIQPGKTAKIEAAVNITGYHSGAISKSVTVTSNAPNDSIARLSVEAVIVAEIEVFEKNLTFGGDDTASSKAIVMASKMKELNATEVFFKTGENSNQKAPEWKKELPLPFKYTWKPDDSVRPDGLYGFTLKISVPKFDVGESGTLIIKTNHPGKPEISINTLIVKTVVKPK